jgi:hypothetical protein
MLVLSSVHDWQGDRGVKQVLVFPHAAMRDIFNKDFASLVEKEGIANASDTNLGAVYKLRAVSNGNGFFNVSIICGMSGLPLEFYDDDPQPLYEDALRIAIMRLASNLQNALLAPLVLTTRFKYQGNWSPE